MTVMIRAYHTADYDQVAALFIRINRELAPDHMREQFEQYIATVIDDELKQLSDIFLSGEAQCLLGGRSGQPNRGHVRH